MCGRLEGAQLFYTRHIMVLPSWNTHFKLGLQGGGGSSSQKSFSVASSSLALEKMQTHAAGPRTGPYHCGATARTKKTVVKGNFCIGPNQDQVMDDGLE